MTNQPDATRSDVDSLSAERKGQGWMPIDSAPKDGSEFLTSNANQGRVKQLVSWNRIHGFWQSKGESIHLQATHWMPIPEPPSCE